MFKRTFYDTGENGKTLIYDVERLWQLVADFPIETIDLSSVESELDYPYQWFKTKKPSPRSSTTRQTDLRSGSFLPDYSFVARVGNGWHPPHCKIMAFG